jgi:hypothetical protein
LNRAPRWESGLDPRFPARGLLLWGMEDQMQQRDDEPLEKLYKPAEAWTALRISRPTFYRTG